MGEEDKKKKQKPRRHKGEGSIFQRADKIWAAQITIKGITKTFYGDTRKEASAQLEAYKLNRVQGFDSLTNVTLKDYITNWLTTVKRLKLKSTSYDRLESTINNHIIERIGHYNIGSLSAPIIQEELINVMYDEGLSYSSVKKAYDAINACLKYATRNRQIIYNPVDTVEKPSEEQYEKRDMAIMTDEERKAFETACVAKYKNGEYIYKNGYGFVLILYTGVRMGEALALKWSDVDFENKKLTISKNLEMVKNRKKKDTTDINYILIVQDTVKTKKGIRTIDLTVNAYNTLLKLKEINYDPDGYILTTIDGNLIRPRNFRNTFDSILQRANIKENGVHMLRHTFASILFREGVDIVKISETLGHSRVSITTDIYVHLIDDKNNTLSALGEL